MLQKMMNLINTHKYSSEFDYPCLKEQFDRYLLEKPLKGKKILNATPLFKNVIPKLLPLIASKAEVVISTPPNIPFDPETVEFLKALEIRCEKSVALNEEFDFVLDCTGTYSQLKKINYGSSELTRSGKEYYEQSKHRCIFIDDSRIKLIEDRIGTSDGMIRALQQLNHNVSHKKILQFGYGKVGKGVYRRLINENSEVYLVDTHPPKEHVSHFILASDTQTVENTVNEVDFVITVTGVKNLIEDHYNVSAFKKNHLIRVNLGAEDEFGPSFNNDEVLNNKAPVNFILNEPTKLKYLDATFALHNESLLTLLNQKFKPGVYPPDPTIVKKYLNISEKAGINLSLLD